MKTLGLIGGTSWRSTIEYYRCINSAVNSFFGNNTNPPLLVYTLNQALVHDCQLENNWSGIAELLIDAGTSLNKAGAEMLMLCANTPHKVYTDIIQKLDIPVLHIADANAKYIKNKGISKVCFLGTKYSMLEPFITQRFNDHNIEVLTPEKNDVIEELHRIIREELTYGNIVPKSKEYVIRVIKSFQDMGAGGVVLGCTEFPLMINSRDVPIPVFDTAKIHSQAGVDFILQDY